MPASHTVGTLPSEELFPAHRTFPAHRRRQPLKPDLTPIIICSHRAAGRRCRRTIRLVRASYRAGACRCAPVIFAVAYQNAQWQRNASDGRNRRRQKINAKPILMCPDVARSRVRSRLWPSHSDANPAVAGAEPPHRCDAYSLRNWCCLCGLGHGRPSSCDFRACCRLRPAKLLNPARDRLLRLR